MITPFIFKNSGWHPYTQAIINNALNLKIDIPNYSYISIIDSLIRELVNIGFWNYLDSFHLLAGGNRASKDFKSINWIKPNENIGSFLGNSVTNINAAINDYGLKGNPTNKIAFYTNHLLVGKYTRNNASLGCTVYEDTADYTDDSQCYIGGDEAGRYPRITGSSNNRIYCGNSNINYGTFFRGSGTKVLNRDSNTVTRGFNNGSTLTRSSNNASVNQEDSIKILLGLSMDKYPNYFTDAGLSLLFSGASLPNSISSLFRSAMNNKYFAPLGLNQIA